MASCSAGHVPNGMGPLKVSVPPELAPPATALGEIVIDVSFGSRFGGRTYNDRFQLEPPLRATIPTSISVLGAVVVMAKFAVREPAVTVTPAGTLAMAGCVLDSTTAVPPAGA